MSRRMGLDEWLSSRGPGVEEPLIRFDASNGSKLLQLREEKTVAATYVEDLVIAWPRRLTVPLPESAEDEPFMDPSPLVFSRDSCVFCVHCFDRRITCWTMYGGRPWTSLKMRPIYSPRIPRNISWTPAKNDIRITVAGNPVGEYSGDAKNLMQIV